jgi:Transposase and inactivated derivatives
MKRFIQGEHRGQDTLLPESLDDYVSDTNPVRVADVFVDELDLVSLGFDGAIPADTGPPAYHPAILLKIYIYGYLNRIQSSRRLEREAQRNIELMWLTGRLMPISRPLPTSEKTTARPSEAFVASSSCSASSWDCLEKIRLPSMAVNSKRSTIVTAISPAPN